MPLEFGKRFSNNWRLSEETQARLEDQAERGWYDAQQRIYLGDSRHISDIVNAFSELLNGDGSTENPKIFVRKSCINKPKDNWFPSGKYQPIEIYFSTGKGDERIVHEATWTPPKKWSDKKIRGIIDDKFNHILNGRMSNLRYTEGFEE